MTGAPMPAPAAEPQPAGLSYPVRIVNVFFAPTKTFTDMKRKSGWLVPFLLIAIVSVLFTAVVDQKIGFDQVAFNQLKMNAKQMAALEQQSPERQARQMEMTAKFWRGFSYIFSIPMLIGYILIAAVMLATLNFGLGAQLKFGAALAVVVYSSLPGIFRELLAIVALFAGVNPEGFMIQNPVATNPAPLVDFAAHPLLWGFLSSLDIFKIWTLILAGIGFACVTKVKRGTSLAVVFGWYFAFTLVSLGIGALLM